MYLSGVCLIHTVLATFRDILGINIYYSTLTQKLQKLNIHNRARGIDIFEALYNLGTAVTTVLAIGHALWCVKTCLNF